MRDFESICASLSDQTIDGAAVKARSSLAALLGHLFDYIVFTKAIRIGPLQNLGKFSAIKLREQKSGAVLPLSASNPSCRQAPYFADALEYRDNFLEIANMKDREYQFEMAKVTIAFLKPFRACFTPVVLVGYSHSLVERSMRVDSAVALKIK
jgi:hypothetical protein